MANYATIVSLASHVLNNNPTQAIMVWGAPGCGKSHLATEGLPVALGMKPMSQPDSPVRMFRPSNHDPVDLTGLPMVTSESTRWVTPDFLLELNALAEQHGQALFVIDELNQAVPMMFNTLNGLILDRRIGDFKLHPGVRIVCTGNRQTDKAASNRMPSHTANRLAHFDMESDLKGWQMWGIKAGLPMWIISFLGFRPNLLNAFDPDKRENPTERSWEMFARAAGDNLPLDLTMTLAQSFVGEGAAAEVAAFRRVEAEMPNPDACLLDPKGSPLPNSLAANYAMASAMAHRATKQNFDSVLAYMGRMDKQYEVLCVRSAYIRKPEIAKTAAFLTWSTHPDNTAVFIGV